MNSVDVQYVRIFFQLVSVTSSLNYDLPSIRCYPSSQLLPTEWALFITADGQVDNMVPVGARVVAFTRTVQRHVQFNVSVKLQFFKHRRGRQRKEKSRARVTKKLRIKAKAALQSQPPLPEGMSVHPRATPSGISPVPVKHMTGGTRGSVNFLVLGNNTMTEAMTAPSRKYRKIKEQLSKPKKTI